MADEIEELIGQAFDARCPVASDLNQLLYMRAAMSSEGRLTSCQLEEGDSKRPNVCLLRIGVARNNFRGHI